MQNVWAEVFVNTRHYLYTIALDSFLLLSFGVHARRCAKWCYFLLICHLEDVLTLCYSIYDCCLWNKIVQLRFVFVFSLFLITYWIHFHTRYGKIFKLIIQYWARPKVKPNMFYYTCTCTCTCTCIHVHVHLHVHVYVYVYILVIRRDKWKTKGRTTMHQKLCRILI